MDRLTSLNQSRSGDFANLRELVIEFEFQMCLIRGNCFSGRV